MLLGTHDGMACAGSLYCTDSAEVLSHLDLGDYGLSVTMWLELLNMQMHRDRSVMQHAAVFFHFTDHLLFFEGVHNSAVCFESHSVRHGTAFAIPGGVPTGRRVFGMSLSNKRLVADRFTMLAARGEHTLAGLSPVTSTS